MSNAADRLTVLAFDCAGPWVACGVLHGGAIKSDVRAMARGQGEALLPAALGLLEKHGLTLHDVDRFAVGTGPGNFTGLRLAVSAARGLALGQGKPSLGVGALDALRVAREEGHAVSIAMPAPIGQSYRMVDGTLALVPDPADTPDLAALMTGTLLRASRAAPPFDRPAPIYLRPADAAPPRDAPPMVID